MRSLAYSNRYTNIFSPKKSLKRLLSDALATQNPRLVTPEKPPHTVCVYQNIPQTHRLNALKRFNTFKTQPPSATIHLNDSNKSYSFVACRIKSAHTQSFRTKAYTACDRGKTLEASSKESLRDFAWRLSAVFI